MKSNELHLNRNNDEGILLQSDSIKITVKAYIPGESEVNGRYYPFVSLSSLWLTENDCFVVFNKFKFIVARIFRDESQILTLADKEDGVLIKKIE